MRTTLRVIAAAIVRSVALIGSFLLFAPVYEYLVYDLGGYEPIGADIGEGLMMFGLVMMMAALWSAVDGWRKPFGEVAVAWVVVGALFGIVSAAMSTWGTAAPSWSLADVVDFAPFLAGLVIVPALCGGALAGLVRPATRDA